MASGWAGGSEYASSGKELEEREEGSRWLDITCTSRRLQGVPGSGSGEPGDRGTDRTHNIKVTRPPRLALVSPLRHHSPHASCPETFFYFVEILVQ
ncbi:hypothetical protein E2C01_055165 [Portunus trituberculatus]|uniref:Uncharacterized protein n=1 Tax=Portunus trituberculatus TaxID=210409 RepID=A0A5B7GLV2_PORTR|nr:hypothetical protein [Portunus trituberculatus]